MLTGAFRLAFGGDEFDVLSFAVPAAPVEITFNGRQRKFNEGRSNEYCLYECEIADGAIRHADGRSIGETVFVALPCIFTGGALEGRGTSAAIIDTDGRVIPVGRGVIWSGTP